MAQSNNSVAANVFISHSHMDRSVATNVQRVLEKHQAKTYLDQDQIQVADVLPDRIRQGIEWCNKFLLLWSLSAARSDWVNREWNRAYELGKQIIPYCLDSTALPPPLGDLVYVDRKDEQVSHANLLRAVFGPSFMPAPTELFPGTWRVRISAFGLGTATYDLDLRANGQITGSGKIDQTGFFGEIMAAEGMAGLLNMQFSVSGTWGYEEQTEILTLNLVAHGRGQSVPERIQISATGREQSEISGQDFAGRSYTIKRITAARDLRAALLQLKKILANFMDTDLTPETMKHETDIMVAGIEAVCAHRTSSEGSAIRQNLDSMYAGIAGVKKLAAGQEAFAARAVVAKGVGAFLLHKVDELWKNLPRQ